LKTVVTEIGSWKRRVEVEVPSQEIHPFIEKAYRSYQKKVHVDGFRKGKVPLSIIQQRFGKAIQAEIVDDLIQRFYKEAIEEERLAVVAPGTIQDVSFEEGKPLRFTAEVEVEPDAHVSGYKGLKVEKEVMKVSDEDVKRAVEVLQEQRAERRSVEGGAEIGHIIEGDIQALSATGVPIIGDKWEDRVFELGSPPLGDVVQDQLLGIVAGEERRFKIVQSERGPDGNVMNREDHYSIKAKSINEKILPRLEDSFAREVGDFKTLAELEEDIRNRLERQRDEEAERMLRNRIADEIVRRNDFEIPPSMIENGLGGLWEEYQKQPEREMDEKQFREENRAGVVWNMKWHLLWKKIAEMEEITMTDEEVDQEIEKIAERSPKKEEKKIRSLFKDTRRRNRLKESMLEDKVFGFLKENARIKEVNIKRPKKTKSTLIT